MNVKKNPFTKALLADVLEISASTLTRYLKKIRPKIIIEYPEWPAIENNSILPKNIFFWLCEKLGGMDKKEVVTRLLELNHPYADAWIKRIEKNFGLGANNPFISS